MTSPAKGTHAIPNPDRVLIVKSSSVSSSFSQLKFEEADPSSSQDVINAYFRPIDENAFTTLLPLKYNANNRNKENLDYNSCIQPIVFEFDVGSIEFQMERIEAVKDHFHIPQFFVHSGNKSLHHYL
jgi:hypothetical protein